MEADRVGSAAGAAADGGEPTTDTRETEAAIPEAAEPIRQTQPTSKLMIKGSGLTFERDVPETVALQIMKLVITGVTENDFGGAGDARRDRKGRQQSLAEFYREVGPKNIPQKLTTIGVYLHDVLGRELFGADELKGQFRHVKETAPGNLPRDLGEAVGAGWLAEEHDKPGVYFVTQSGHDAVEDKFATDGGRRGARPRRKRKATKAAVAEAPSNGE